MPRHAKVMGERTLRNAVKHIAFDIYHYQCYDTLCKNITILQHSGAAHQAIVYTLLLQLRLLLVFFYRPSKFDDCNLDRFSILPGFDDRFGTLRRRQQAEMIIVNLNKRLAHITARRWRVQAPIMNYYTSFSEEMDRLITQFEQALPKGLQREYAQAKEQWATYHPPVIY